MELQGESHCFKWDQDIGKQDCRIHAQNIYRLDGYLCSQFRGLAEFEERELASDSLVFRQVAAGLTHHPYGCVIYIFASAGFEKGIVHIKKSFFEINNYSFSLGQ
jgi:hypothetical protein